MATIRRRRDKYEVQVRRSGLPHVSKTFHVLKDAQEWARHMEVQADRKDLPADPKVLRSVTLAELVTRYKNTITVGKRGCVAETAVLNSFLLHPTCRRRLSDISATLFASYRDERLREVSVATVKRQLGILRHMFNVAHDEWGLPIKENPLSKLQFKGADQRRERRLLPGELERLVQAAKSRRNPLIETIILFAIETGMRRGEILAVRRRDIDAENRALLIPETKTGRSRTIPLTTLALQLLSQHDTDPVFQISPNAFRLAWERVKRRSEIDDLRFHDLRHEAISRFFEMGLNAAEVALISGHRDMRMLARYTHPQLQLINRKLDAALQSPQV